MITAFIINDDIYLHEAGRQIEQALVRRRTRQLRMRSLTHKIKPAKQFFSSLRFFLLSLTFNREEYIRTRRARY
jgi:hypothetical protein